MNDSIQPDGRNHAVDVQRDIERLQDDDQMTSLVQVFGAARQYVHSLDQAVAASAPLTALKSAIEAADKLWTRIAFDAVEFTPQSVNVFSNPLYDGMVTNSLGNDASKRNRVTYAFEALHEAWYRCEIDYAAAQSRPVSIWVNGVLISHQALAGTTGGWRETSVITSGIGRVPIKRGANFVEIERPSAIPHLRRLRFLLN